VSRAAQLAEPLVVRRAAGRFALERAISASMRSMRFFVSSIAAGVALCASATLAQAVSSTLIALSGSWRPLM
jgi:hypothetical protein